MDKQNHSPEEWPIDPPGCVFLGRVVERIGLEAALGGIITNKLKVYVRLIDATDGRLGRLPPGFTTPEMWVQSMEMFQIELLDQRPGIPSRERRRIPQPHWLFVSKASLERMFPPQQPTVGAEARAIAELAKALKTNPDLARERARELCATAGIELALKSRPFERIWRSARVAVGLPEIAPAGRKKREKPGII